MFKFFLAGAVSILLAGCGNSSSDGTAKPKKPKTEIQTMSAKFSSMSKCLKSIEKESKASLNIVTDKPEEVSGFLGDSRKLGFSCEIRATGTEGIVINGWYMIEEEVL